MRKVDRDADRATDPQVVLTPTEARSGVIRGRVIWVLIVGTALAGGALLAFALAS